MKKSARYFLKFIFIAFCLYSAQALAFVDPPTFAPLAPNSVQAILVSVRYGICDGIGQIPGPGERPPRIEYFSGVIDIYTPGSTSPSGACNVPIATVSFNVAPRPAGDYQVRIWMLDDLAFPVPATILVSQASLTVIQGAETMTPVSVVGIGGSAILIALILASMMCVVGIKRAAFLSIVLAVSSTGFAQTNEKTLPVLLSAAPGAPAPIDLVEPVNFSGGYLGVLSPGFVAENPTRAFYLLPKLAMRCSVSMQNVVSQKLTPRNYL